MEAINKEESYPLNITSKPLEGGSAICASSLNFTVNGSRIDVVNCDIHKIDSKDIVMATITVPVTFES